ncbi:MAG: hypothetical protein EHM25_02620 [Nitrosopumilales archaeon]|nr:MAG: hypothetical protein EHM25_12710 [Nitrosopumilales archaeon]RPJ31547.1 MAG: hypothetical protein EHM25_02620 [Nitrosopumilales archaeon]
MEKEKISKIDVEINLNNCDYEKYQKESIRIHKEIMIEFKKNNIVEIIFRDKPYLSIKFIETAFVQVLKEYDYDYIKQHLILTNISPTAFYSIKERLILESNNKNKTPHDERMTNIKLVEQRNKKFNEIDWNTIIG